MGEIIAIMAAGILLGWLIRNKKKFLAIIDKLIVFAIFLLLFFLGSTLGANEKVLNGIATLGVNALLTAIGAVSGSVFAAWLLWKLLFKKKIQPPN